MRSRIDDFQTPFMEGQKSYCSIYLSVWLTFPSSFKRAMAVGPFRTCVIERNEAYGNPDKI